MCITKVWFSGPSRRSAAEPRLTQKAPEIIQIRTLVGDNQIISFYYENVNIFITFLTY